VQQPVGEAEAMRPRGQQGIALIAVLWALTLLSIIAALLSLETRTGTRIAENMADAATARVAADAGIQRAILDLAARHRKFRADGTVYGWHFADSNVRISIQDEGGKINLNLAPQDLLTALFASVGVEPNPAKSLAEAIVDFRDEDDYKHPNGAEEFDYRAAELPWGPKNAPFAAVEELRQVLGMTPEIYQLVAPDLTIYTSTPLVNAVLASKRLTATLSQAGSAYLLGYPGMAYSIRAEADSFSGGVFVREAVVEPVPEAGIPRIVSWQQGAPRLASIAGPNPRR
jgi:type II secretory pathway component PulK